MPYNVKLAKYPLKSDNGKFVSVLTRGDKEVLTEERPEEWRPFLPLVQEIRGFRDLIEQYVDRLAGVIDHFSNWERKYKLLGNPTQDKIQDIFCFMEGFGNDPQRWIFGALSALAMVIPKDLRFGQELTSASGDL